MVAPDRGFFILDYQQTAGRAGVCAGVWQLVSKEDSLALLGDTAGIWRTRMNRAKKEKSCFEQRFITPSRKFKIPFLATSPKLN